MYLFAVKDYLMGDQYRERYPVGQCKLADEQLIVKDYTINGSNDFFVGDQSDSLCPSDIAKFFNCSLKSSGVKNNYDEWGTIYSQKIAARIINVIIILLNYLN